MDTFQACIYDLLATEYLKWGQGDDTGDRTLRAGLLFFFNFTVVHLLTDWFCLLVLRQGLPYPKVTSNPLSSPGWPWPSDPLASTSQILGLQELTTMPSLWRAGNPAPLASALDPDWTAQFWSLITKGRQPHRLFAPGKLTAGISYRSEKESTSGKSQGTREWLCCSTASNRS